MPDLNRIQHLCHALIDALYDVYPQIGMIQGSKAIGTIISEAIPEAGRLIPASVVCSCLDSVKDRIEAVNQVGWNTRN